MPKARAAASATGRPAIADDSGIEAAALDGRPGVRSARYAGPDATDEENLLKLMDEAPVGSALRYVCALAFSDPSDSEERVFIGECRGRLAAERRGTRGFGYDPAFLPDEDPARGPDGGDGDGSGGRGGDEDGDAESRTMAELSEAEKDAISHRGHALRAFAEWYLS